MTGSRGPGKSGGRISPEGCGGQRGLRRRAGGPGPRTKLQPLFLGADYGTGKKARTERMHNLLRQRTRKKMKGPFPEGPGFYDAAVGTPETSGSVARACELFGGANGLESLFKDCSLNECLWYQWMRFGSIWLQCSPRSCSAARNRKLRKAPNKHSLV